MAKRGTSAEKKPVGVAQGKPNILIIWGDDIGQSNLSVFTKGMMGCRTPNIDRIANEGMLFTNYYAEQSCIAGRAAFMMGQSVFRSGLSKVGLPGAAAGMQAEDPTIAELLKPHGYVTGQVGKNHLGDRDEHLPTMHGFDEFFGNFYHLNAGEEPELGDYPPEKDFPNFKKNERADVTSNTYYDWLLDHAYHLVPAQQSVGQFLATFKEFPPRQKAASFSIDQVMESSLSRRTAWGEDWGEARKRVRSET